jgi:transcriptional regulator with GAF, ATPase, and Fis domain
MGVVEFTANATQSADGAARRETEVDLVILEQRSYTRRALAPQGSLRIGRAEDADVVLQDPAASRRHALLHVGAEFSIEDLDSRNGTLVRGAPLAPGKRVPIGPGDAVQIGGAFLVLQPRSRGDEAVGVEGSSDAAADGGAVCSNAPAMRAVYDMVESVAASHLTVLITGETGVGKELVAEAIHRSSGARSARAFLRINCAALTPTLLESELFGHERGAFTGAVREKHGLFEAADGGTAFLDEIGELSPAAQAKLLRVLETREVIRVGGVKGRLVDVRFIAATNRDLPSEVARGSFREDLYFRINGASVFVPPLRHRIADVEPLVAHFVSAFCRQMQRPSVKVGADAVERLRAYPWPGNVRELRNVVECAVLRARGRVVEVDDLPPEWLARARAAHAPSSPRSAETRPPGAVLDLTEAQWGERERIVEALASCHGNQTRAAEWLRMPRRTLVAKLSAYAIPRPRLPRRDTDA